MTLPQMICNYQNNNDLDSLRDILEYLKSNPVYVITKIKISKKIYIRITVTNLS